MSKASRPKVTFSLTPVVRLEIRGKPHPDGFPMIPDDGGICQKFSEFERLTKIGPRFFHASGGGIYTADYAEQYADAIRQWLVDNGVEEFSYSFPDEAQHPSDERAGEIVSDLTDESYETQREVLRRLVTHLVEAGEL